VGTNRVYDRVEYQGVEYIKILEKDTLKRLDVSWCKTKEDLQSLNRLYQELMETARKWYWVDTGVQLTLVPTDYGFMWLISDEAENSRRLQWLISRADRYEQKIVNRINKYASVLASEQEGEDNGHEEGELDSYSS
jgi:hypothetical protein